MLNTAPPPAAGGDVAGWTWLCPQFSLACRRVICTRTVSSRAQGFGQVLRNGEWVCGLTVEQGACRDDVGGQQGVLVLSPRQGQPEHHQAGCPDWPEANSGCHCIQVAGLHKHVGSATCTILHCNPSCVYARQARNRRMTEVRLPSGYFPSHLDDLKDCIGLPCLKPTEG